MGLETGWKRGRGGWKRGKSGGEIRCQVAGNPVSVHHSCPGKSGGKSGVEIRCQFIILARRGNPVSGGKSGVSSSFLPGGKSGVRGESGVSSSFLPGEKSGVSSSGGGNPVSVEIRCQFIILARGEIRCQFRGNPVSGKSGVSSSFLPEKMIRHRITHEKMNRHRITQAIVEAPGSIRDSGGRTLTTSPHLPQGEMP